MVVRTTVTTTKQLGSWWPLVKPLTFYSAKGEVQQFGINGIRRFLTGLRRVKQ